MNKIKGNKGITLSTLMITVIIISIITVTATFTGIDVYNSAKEEAFAQELQIVQNAVNNMISKGDLQESLPTAKSNSSIIEQEHPIRNEDMSKYKYLSKDKMKQLGIAGVNQDVYVNFETSKVYSVKGYNGKYTLNDFNNMNIIYSKALSN